MAGMMLCLLVDSMLLQVSSVLHSFHVEGQQHKTSLQPFTLCHCPHFTLTTFKIKLALVSLPTRESHASWRSRIHFTTTDLYRARLKGGPQVG